MLFETSIGMPLSAGPYLLMDSDQEEEYLRGTPSQCSLQQQHLGSGQPEFPHLSKSITFSLMTGCCSMIAIANCKKFLILRKIGIENTVATPCPKPMLLAPTLPTKMLLGLMGQWSKEKKGI